MTTANMTISFTAFSTIAWWRRRSLSGCAAGYRIDRLIASRDNTRNVLNGFNDVDEHR